ncbi:MAG: hypothetical protein K2O95_04690 [Clostridia bacterium]|nr:hypothetical protein [Clostridia bacterium]
MIITFCGHSKLTDCDGISEKVFEVLKNIKSDKEVYFYLGGYGSFDALAAICCKRYKEIYKNAKLFFITPYLDDVYLKNRECSVYDETIYPEIENVPLKFAISKRNKWMVDNSDLLIAYVNFSWGGAVKTLEYAHRKNKAYINLGNYKL